MEKDLDYIIEKASELYLQYGIKSLTMDDLARELGISKKTLYQFVTDKSDLVKRVIMRKFDQYKCRIDNYPEDLNAIEILVHTNEVILEMMKKSVPSIEYDLLKYYPEVWNELISTRRKVIYEQIRQNLQQGIAEGLYREELNIPIIAKIHASRAELKWQSGFFTMEEMMSPAVMTEMLVYHLRGICNAKGLEILEKKMFELKNKK